MCDGPQTSHHIIMFLARLQIHICSRRRVSLCHEKGFHVTSMHVLHCKLLVVKAGCVRVQQSGNRYIITTHL